MKQELLHPELSYQITGLCFKAHNILGRFAKEKQYCDLLEQLLIKENIKYQREVRIEFRLSNQNNDFIGGNIADFIIKDLIVIECKAKRFIVKDDYYQIQRYLEATNLKLGLIVNFRDRYLKPKRIINYSHHSH
ncbi:MAG: GxxExxY protein [Candidatus Paceibacterota bacterium]